MASSKKEKKNWIPSPAQLPQHLFLSIFQAGLESHSVTDNINYCIQLMNWETATYSWCVHFILPHFWKPLICRLQKENKQPWFNKTDHFLISEITADWIIYQEKTKGFFFFFKYIFNILTFLLLTEYRSALQPKTRSNETIKCYSS